MCVGLRLTTSRNCIYCPYFARRFAYRTYGHLHVGQRLIIRRKFIYSHVHVDLTPKIRRTCLYSYVYVGLRLDIYCRNCKSSLRIRRNCFFQPCAPRPTPDEIPGNICTVMCIAPTPEDSPEFCMHRSTQIAVTIYMFWVSKESMLIEYSQCVQ